MSGSDSDESFDTLENNSSSEDITPPFKFLDHLRNLANPQTITPEALKWRNTESLGDSRVFDSIDCPDSFIPYIKQLFDITDDQNTTPDNISDKLTTWANTLLPSFNELFDDNGEIKDEVCNFSGVYNNSPGDPQPQKMVHFTNTYTRSQKAQLLWGAFIGWIGQCAGTYADKYPEYHLKNITYELPNAPLRCESIHSYLTTMTGSSLILNDFDNTTNQYSISTIQFTYSKDEEAAFVFNLDELKSLLCIKKTKENKYFTKFNAELNNIPTLIEALHKRDNQHTTLFNNIMFIATKAIEEIKASDERTNTAILLDSSKRLTELANTLLGDKKDLNNNIAREGKYKLAGILLGLAGLAIATVSITLAVATCGISTPLSLLGLHVGVSMIGCGLSVGAAALGLTTCTGLGFFTALKARADQNNYKKEIANLPNIAERLQLSESLTQLADVAQQKVNTLTN